MTIPLQIAFEGGLEPSEALKRRIEREALKLERFHDRILGCRVAVIGRSGRKRHGDLYAVRLQVAMPGREDLVVNRNPPADHAHEDAFVTVRDAFNAARRRLQYARRRLEGNVKVHAAPPEGRIRSLFPEAGYGFIETDDGREIYFHRNAIVDGDFEHLHAGASVRFAESEGEKGPQASTVHVKHESRR